MNKIMKRWLALGISVFGCCLLIAAFIVHPTGEIHASILTAFASCLTYSGALFGIEMKDLSRPLLKRGDPSGSEEE